MITSNLKTSEKKTAIDADNISEKFYKLIHTCIRTSSWGTFFEFQVNQGSS